MFARVFRDARRVATILCMAIALSLCAQGAVAAVDDALHLLEVEQAVSLVAGPVKHCTSATDSVCPDKDGSHMCCGDAFSEGPVATSGTFCRIEFSTAFFLDKQFNGLAARMHIALERPPQDEILSSFRGERIGL